jgi:hypothetical protein
VSIACIVNTSCLAPDAETRLSSGKVPYGRRAWLLRNVILPTYRWANTFSEIIVVGEFEAGDGYEHIPADSVYHTCADALWKRQLAVERLRHPTVEWVLFQHDDHLYDPNNMYPLTREYPADVLSPSRWTRARTGAGEALNDGTQAGHMNGHACLMRPSVFRAGFSWADTAPVFTWDQHATKKLADLGLVHARAPELRTWDLEEGAHPWA